MSSVASHALAHPGGVSEVAAGVRILVPGLPQWTWRQYGRAGLLFGSYLSALGVGLFAWGTVAGPALLAFAFGTHVASAADVVRQRAFPGFGRWVPVISASAGLGLGYAPLLGTLWMVAWPGQRTDLPREGYLVNLWAYRVDKPEPGHWVWFDRPWSGGRGVGQVLARSGQEVEWFDGGLRVAEAPVAWTPTNREAARAVQHLILTVPDGHLLVAPLEGANGSREDGMGLVLLDQDRIQGRAWAQHAPIWRRRLLR